MINDFNIPDRVWDDIVELSGKPTAFEHEGSTPRPPWMVFPDVGRYSIGWRMGAGQDYRHAFVQWYLHSDSISRAEYREKYPGPASWLGYYEDLEKETLTLRQSKNPIKNQVE